MQMIYEPAKKTIAQLLNDEEKKTSVPDYQRDYSWTDSHVDYFWQDIIEFMNERSGSSLKDAEYFIGSMVRVNHSDGYELLDGQQRLATTVILLSIIRDRLKDLNLKASHKTQDRWIAEEDDRTQEKRYTLTLSRYDRDYFRRRIQDEGQVAPAPNSKSQGLIDAAHKKIAGEIDSVLASKADASQKTEWLLLLRSVILDHVTTVTVTCGNGDDAASIFETLNDRGLGLSTVDLLRNYILRSAGESDREEILAIWGDILAEPSVDVDEFLRHYWTSKRGDIKSQRLYRAISHDLKDNRTSSLDFMRALGIAHAAYVRLLRPDFAEARINDRLADIADLKAKMLYPLLLSGLIAKEEEFSDLLHACIIFYVRQGVVARQNSSQMEKVVYAAAAKLHSGASVAVVLKGLHRSAASEETFEAAARSISGLDTASARYVLREIEFSLRNNEETDVARQPRIHVEHVYPKTPMAGLRWSNHAEYVNKLGNLTLLARRINTSIRNGAFEQKRPELAKSELFLTVEVAQCDQWTTEEIDARQERLAEKIKTIWSWPPAVLEAMALPDEE